MAWPLVLVITGFKWLKVSVYVILIGHNLNRMGVKVYCWDLGEITHLCLANFLLNLKWRSYLVLSG